LSNIKQANITYVKRIDIELGTKTPNVARLKDNVEQLGATLQDISAATGFEISILQVDLKALSSWAKGGQDVGPPVPSQLEKKYIKFLNKNHNG
jgi:hypothetical protein